MPTTLISPLTLNIPSERLRPRHRGGLLPRSLAGKLLAGFPATPRGTYSSLILHNGICDTPKQFNITSNFDVWKMLTWGESGFPARLLVARSMLRRRQQIILVVRPTGNGTTRLRPARKLPANPRPLFVNAAREGGLIQHRAALPRMVLEQQIAAAVGSGRDIGGGTQVHRRTVKHGDLLRFQPQDQRPTTAHRSALIHADAAGLFGREIQQRITPPLASTVSFSIRTVAVTSTGLCGNCDRACGCVFRQPWVGHGRLRESSEKQLRWPAVLTAFRCPAAAVSVNLSAIATSRLVAPCVSPYFESVRLCPAWRSLAFLGNL